MDSFEFNKVAGAVLGTLVFTMGLGFASNAIFKPNHSEKPGYVIDVPEEKAGAADSAEPVVAPIAERLATADPAKGATLTKACQTCHKFEKGGANATGPALYGVVDRQQGTEPGFSYSSAIAGLGAKGGKWTYENIDAFITNPKAYASGTKMGYAGMKDPVQRANVIAYLRTLSDNPVPLPPKPEPASPAAPAPAPASPAPPAAVPPK